MCAYKRDDQMMCSAVIYSCVNSRFFGRPLYMKGPKIQILNMLANCNRQTVEIKLKYSNPQSYLLCVHIKEMAK